MIALASAKGSPGVTVTSLALAAVWPRPVLVAECDPAGGDLAARWRLPATPSLLTLAAAARRRLDPDELWRHTQTLPDPRGPGGGGAGDSGRVRVLLGPLEAEQASALGRLWSSLGPALAQVPGTDVLVDCGRIWPGGPTGELLTEADLVLLVARPTTEGLAHARSRLLGLEQAGIMAGLVLIGDRPHPLSDVGPALDAVGVRPALLASLVEDERAAAMLAGGPGSARRLGGSLLVRSARGLAERLLIMPGGRPAPGALEVAHEAPPQRHQARPDWPTSPATGVVS